MRPQYSLVHLTNAACPPPEMIRIAARAGYNCVSLRSIPTRMKRQNASVDASKTGQMPFDLSGNRALFLATRQAAKEEGICLHDTENARIFDGVDIRDYEQDLETAAELGIREILTNIWSEDSSFYEDAFARLCELAASYKQNVNLEFVTWSAVKDLKAAASLVRHTNCSNAGILLDTLHFYRSGNDPEDLEELPKEWFRYAHLCDCPKEIPADSNELIHTGLNERLFPGEGSVDIRSILNKIPHVIRGIEVPNPVRMNPLGYEAYARLALEATKQYLDI